MSELIGLIPAAGRGVRAYPYTDTIPKSMLEVDGVPLILRNLQLLRDQLDVHDIRIVTGHRGEVIREHLGDGGRFGVRIRYVENPRLDLELPYSVYLAAREIQGPCCMVLADECYVDTNHRELLDTAFESALATLAFIETDNPKHVRKNYVGTFRQGRVVALEEKPVTVTSMVMGTGTYLLHPALLQRLVAAFEPDPERGPRDWTAWLDHICREGGLIRPFFLRGLYVNVNSRDDLAYANYLVRDCTFDSKAVSLVYVVDHEQDEAVQPATRFATENLVDEVVVACRRRTPGVEAIGALPKVRIALARHPDLDTGDLVKLGLDEARGDILVLAYSDDSFVPHDISKLLVYLRDADMVVGSRTTRQLIEQGTNMRGLVRAVHIGLAKLVELLWWRFECRFTDVCCVYRALWKSTYQAVRGNLMSSGVEVFPELVIEALRARKRIIEVPVNYRNRDVGSPYVRSRYQSPAVLGRILGLILRKRLRDARMRLASETAQSGRRPAHLLLPPAETVAEHRRLEREWQDSVGHALLDRPYATAGSAAVFVRQFDRIAELLRPMPAGPIVEVGCGRGHLLRHLRATGALAGRLLVGIDLSRAVFELPAHGLAGLRADGQGLPFRDASVGALVYDGALHHMIDYPAALREAMRVLRPGGLLVLFEPVSSRFTRFVHRTLDPLVFRSAVVYESPIDRLYKRRFREDVVLEVVREGLVPVVQTRSDFLAYPLTGCYAGSAFGRSVRFMRGALAVEAAAWRIPGVRWLAHATAWRFLIVAVKQDAVGASSGLDV